MVNLKMTTIWIFRWYNVFWCKKVSRNSSKKNL